jgi:hypothetical protein
MEQRTKAFRRRANLAGGLFLSICEALLDSDPERGVRLWHALCRVLLIKLMGVGGINEWVHMPFRAPDNTVVQRLRGELYRLAYNPTDKDYLDLVICVLWGRREQWLLDRISDDKRSNEDWRRKRANSSCRDARVP